MYKIAAHRGNNAKNGKGVIKGEILNLLEDEGYNFYSDLEHGNFLVRLQRSKKGLY